MNRKFKILALTGLIISSAAMVATSVYGQEVKAVEDKLYYVDFFDNYLREEFTLSNGFIGKGNNLIFKTVQVSENSLVAKPEDPTRKNYEFQGWFKEEKCENAWDFDNEKVTHDTRLFAKWGVAEVIDDPKPPFTPPSTVLEDSAATDYVIDSIMYFKVNANVVKLPRAALMKLEAQKDNVLPLMEYRVKNGKTFTATYESNYITVTCSGNVQSIQVKDDSASYILSNSTYESKAKKYEENALVEDSYHVMLAGSSSIEFWTNSAEDLDPIISYNHGIGGTTIEEWDESLNQRLVFPYKPKMVVYYVGINNVINSKEDAATIWSKLKKFFDDTHEALPDTKVQYIMMNLIPGFPAYFNVINTVNAQAVKYQESNPWLTLINPGVALLKENGQPNAAFFRTDGLHLSNYGYVVWGGIIKKSIIDGLENN